MATNGLSSNSEQNGHTNGSTTTNGAQTVRFEVQQQQPQRYEESRDGYQASHSGSEATNGDTDGTESLEIDMDMTTIIDTDAALIGLEVDDETDTEDDTARRAAYAQSIYPTIPAHYRTERIDSDFETVNSSTMSIYEGDVDFVEEYGRRYCKEYYMPNDEEEQDRMRIVHQVYLNVFNLELTSVPLDDPEIILDVGTGTGEWVMGMAEKYPDCDVIGMDISPIQDTRVPNNCNWECDDAELEWERAPDSIDLVHFRGMAGAFSDWSFVYEQAFKCIKPGGYIELVDFHDFRGPQNFYSKFPPDSIMHQFALDMHEAELRCGRRRGVDHLNRQLLIDAGFVDVEITEHAIPLDPSTSPLGKLWLVACRAGLEASTLRPLTKYMGWAPEKVRETCAIVGQQLISMAMKPETNKGFEVKLRVLVARKPWVAGQWTAQNLGENGDLELRDYSTGDDSTIGS